MTDTPPTRATILIAGPTASGKSALALAIAERFGGVVINADSMQVYRELNILTARPGAAETARAPHRLYGVLPAARRCSAALWRDMAAAEIARAHAAGRPAIVVGGTGLYFRALTEGFSPVPEVAEDIRRQVGADLERMGFDAYLRRFARQDPEQAARIRPGDRQRLIRAAEVLAATGRSLSYWQSLPADGGVLDAPPLTLLLQAERRWLYARCDARLEWMLDHGALEEVEALLALGLDPDLPAMKALGVAEFAALLRGELSRDQALSRAQMLTRRYAKRQMTWFRHQMQADQIVDAQHLESMAVKIFPKICKFLLTRPG